MTNEYVYFFDHDKERNGTSCLSSVYQTNTQGGDEQSQKEEKGYAIIHGGHSFDSLSEHHEAIRSLPFEFVRFSLLSRIWHGRQGGFKTHSHILSCFAI